VRSERVNKAREFFRRLDEYVAELKSENDRLRELVRELYEDQCIDGDRWKYRDRMRELGIEVDE